MITVKKTGRESPRPLSLHHKHRSLRVEQLQGIGPGWAYCPGPPWKSVSFIPIKHSSVLAGFQVDIDLPLRLLLHSLLPSASRRCWWQVHLGNSSDDQNTRAWRPLLRFHRTFQTSQKLRRGLWEEISD